jgi:hypothetical protein
VSDTKTTHKAQHMTATKNIAHQAFTFTLMKLTIAISHHTGRILPSMLQHG